MGMGNPYTIIRPTLVFGAGDLLLNNMAWALRRFLVFPVFGKGDYKIQPVYAEDLAALAVDAGSRGDSFVADAAAPDTFTFEELLWLLAQAVGARVRMVHTLPSLGFALTRLVGLQVRDTGADLRQGRRADGLVADFQSNDGGNYQLGRLAYRQCRRSRLAVRARTAAQLPMLGSGSLNQC